MPPGQAHTSEIQSNLTLGDYLALLERYRRWYVAGALISVILTFLIVKFATLKFYLSESRFYIKPRVEIVGVADIKLFPATQNEQFQTAVNTELADQILHSAELLTSTTQILQVEGHDVHALLKIDEAEPEIRKSVLLKQLRSGLVDISPIQNSGVVEYGVELPDSKAAARFNQISLDLLQLKFIDIYYGYFAKARDLYELELTTMTQKQQALARKLEAFIDQHQYESVQPTIIQEREILDKELDALNLAITDLRQRVEKLRLATSVEALRAAQPIQIINAAEVPLKKSRPRTILSTGIGFILFTFVFFTCVMLMGMWQALSKSSRARQVTSPRSV